MKDFSSVQVSTQTFTVKSNIQNIWLQNFFDVLQIQDGITCIKFHTNMKGVCEKKTSAGKNFLKCITCIIQLDKFINVKIFRNGVFQLTGCKHIQHVIDCLKIILFKLEKCKQYTLFEPHIIIYIKSAMRNVDFDLGHVIKRDELLKVLMKTTSYIIPPRIGNKMDIKIRIPIEREDMKQILITKITFKDNKMFKENIPYDEYLKCNYTRNKPGNKCTSLSIFQNGKVLLSSIDSVFQEKYYIWIMNLIHTHSSVIDDNVKQNKTFGINLDLKKYII